MQISAIDIIIIITYLIAVALIGSLSGGRQKSTKDYFMGGKSVPWWAVSFSIVAAETSSLTFISIPGLAYISNLNFLQLTIGYLIARILVAVFFLPSYRKGELVTAYSFLENRFSAAGNPADVFYGICNRAGFRSDFRIDAGHCPRLPDDDSTSNVHHADHIFKQRR